MSGQAQQNRRNIDGISQQELRRAPIMGYQQGYDDGRQDERKRIVAYLGKNWDDIERCLAAYDIEAGEHND